MLRLLPNGTVVGLIAMNQTAKAVILIVYRLTGGHVKLFRQITIRTVKIPVFQRAVPFFLGDAVQNVIGIADLRAVAIGHGVEVPVLGSVIIAGKLPRAHRNAGHVSKTVIVHLVGLILLDAVARNIAAAPYQRHIATSIGIADGNHAALIGCAGTVIVKIGVPIDRSVRLRLGIDGSPLRISVGRGAPVGVRLAGQLRSIGRVAGRGDNLSSRSIAVAGKGRSGAVSILIVDDIHGNIVVGDLRNQMIVVAVFVLVGIGTGCFALRLRQLIPCCVGKAAAGACCIDSRNIAVCIIGVGSGAAGWGNLWHPMCSLLSHSLILKLLFRRNIIYCYNPGQAIACRGISTTFAIEPSIILREQQKLIYTTNYCF